MHNQRLSGEGRAIPASVELKVRVPLEKEVPVAAVIKEPQPVKEEREFPELTEVSAPKGIAVDPHVVSNLYNLGGFHTGHSNTCVIDNLSVLFF